jgi:hypothetical protein
MMGPISRDGRTERREEDVTLELSLDMEDEEPHQSDGREGELEGIGAIFDGWINIADPEQRFHEMTNCLAGIA